MSDDGKNPNIGSVFGALAKITHYWRAPDRNYEKEKQRYMEFYNETLKPTLREKELWEQTNSDLEALVASENGENSVNLVQAIYSRLDEVRDSYKAQLKSQLEVYKNQGPPRYNNKIDTIKLKNELAPAQIKCRELIAHYEAEADKIMEEKGVSKAKMYAWGIVKKTKNAAAVGAGVLLLAKKILK